MVSEARDAPLDRSVPSRYWRCICLLGVHMRKAAKRELIETRTDKRYVRRDERGQFKESEEVGRASAGNQRRRAKQVSERGQGYRGDRNLALNSE